MRFTTIALATTATLALAACNPSSSDTAAKGSSAADRAAPAPAAAALDGPKPGLWRTTVTTNMPGAPTPAPIEACVTQAKFEAPSNAAPGGAASGCTSVDFKREGDAVVGSTTCNVSGVTTQTNTRVTGDFNSRYVMESTTKMDPAPTPSMAEFKTTITGERIGDCPAS